MNDTEGRRAHKARTVSRALRMYNVCKARVHVRQIGHIRYKQKERENARHEVT